MKPGLEFGIRGFGWMVLFFLAAGIVAGRLPFGATRAAQKPVPSLAVPTDDLPPARSFFRLHNEQNGLAQKYIYTVAADQRGFIWIGSDDGAAYYNGRTWTTLNMPNPSVSNEVTAVCPSIDGSVWFGRSAGGVVRLRNGRWTIFDSTNSQFPNVGVTALLETVSPAGAPILWAGLTKGLARFADGQWSVFNAENSRFPKGALSNCLLETVSSGGDRSLWIGTNIGLARFKPGPPAEWTTYDATNSGLSITDIVGLAEQTLPTGERFLWIGGSGGFAAFAHERDPNLPPEARWVAYTSKNTPLSARYVMCFLPSRSLKGTPILWIGTDGGLVRLEASAAGDTPTKPESAFRPIPDPTDPSAWRLLTDQNSNLPINGINRVIETVSGERRTAWIATRGNGVAAWEDGWWRTCDTANSGLPNNLVAGLAEAVAPDGRSAYWFATDENGIARYENGTWTQFTPQNSNVPKSISCILATTTPEGRSEVWFGSKDGTIGRFEGDRWKIFDLPKSPLAIGMINSLHEMISPTGERTIWATGKGGILHWRAGEWSRPAVEDPRLESANCFRMAVMRDEKGDFVLWIASYGGGLIRYKEPSSPGAKGAVTFFTPKNSALPNDQVLSLHPSVSPSGEPVLWVGTTAGVQRLNPNRPDEPGLVLSTSTTPAIPDNMIFEIREDGQKRIYLFTNKGVVRLTPTADPSGYKVFTFTTEDGLPINTCNMSGAMVDRRGRVWAGTIKGAAVFDPSDRAEDREPKPLVMTRTLLDGRPFQADRRTSPSSSSPVGPGGDRLDGTSLAHDEANLLFEFSLLGVGKVREASYRTRLVGLDDEPSAWGPDTRREYPILPAGSYAFKVWGRDEAGNESGPLTVSFTVRPPPWRTWWAYGLYAVALGGLIFGGVRMRHKVLRDRNLLLEKSVAQRTEELSQKNVELDRRVEELAHKNTELARQREEILQSYQQAGRIFNALAEALPGTVLDDKYRLDEKIGAGGFGAVFRATHLGLKRDVAVKVFRPVQGNASMEALERFKREAVSACRINHPNAVAVIDSGVATSGVAYLVMELLDGRPLSDEIRRVGVFSPRRCAELLLPICDVLAKAHAAGIIHRDIKPDNVFLHRVEDGREIVKVVDFGIAKLLGDAREAEMETLTATNHIVGTPMFMAPERLTNSHYDGKSDVYSVGVMAYLMLCGKPPYSSQSGIGGIILQQMTSPPPPLRKFNPDVPEGVERVVMGAIEKSTGVRPGAMKFARELAEAVGLEYQEAFTRTGEGVASSPATDEFGPTIQFAETTQRESFLREATIDGAANALTVEEQNPGTPTLAHVEETMDFNVRKDR